MFKKLFFTAAAAAAVSVPLAGAAWAVPPQDDPNRSDPPGQSVAGHGIPQVAGAIADQLGTRPPGSNPGDPLPPGKVFNYAKDLFPGDPTPVAYGKALNQVFNTNIFTNTAPGLGVKSAAPGCSSGHTAGDANICSGP
jgi:hypothetical protein